MEEYEILEELKMLIRCSDFAQNLSCDGVSVDFLKSTLDLILKQKSEIERNKSAGNSAENHGHWIFVNPPTELIDWEECSECGYKNFNFSKFNFCPNCGAKMYEEKEND